MKKSLIALLTVALVVVFYGMAMAALATGNIGVTADVAQYAQIRDLPESISIDVQYDGDGYSGTNNANFTVESNCSVTVTATSPVELTKDSEPNLPATATIKDGTSTEKGTLNPTITLDVNTTEDISDRSAGTYTGTVTVTVSAN
ncbi:MAG: hypothetical protein K6U11_12210 [bacterium]|nr:hypothetical protein [bacterium]